jgi:uncharacterized membrane protein HdeD (DUF308 family)
MPLYFMALGIFRAVIGIALRFPNCGWVFLSGVISFMLEVMIKSQYPTSEVRMVGLFIGIDLIFNGWSYVMLALGAKKEPAPASPLTT